jgi:tellurite resistance protein TehA-like permease
MVVGIIFCAATALTLQLQLSLILMVIVDVCLTSAFQMLQVLMKVLRNLQGAQLSTQDGCWHHFS